MLTASREKTPKCALATTAGSGRTADDRELSAVLQGDLQNTFPPDKRMDDDHQNAAPPHECVDHNEDQNVAAPVDHQSTVSPDECMNNDHQTDSHQIAAPSDDQITVSPDDQNTRFVYRRISGPGLQRPAGRVAI